jgi:hypothetical protein
VHRAIVGALNARGRLAWLSELDSARQRYEQRTELTSAIDSAAARVHFSHDEARQAAYQVERFRTQIAPMAVRVRSLEAYSGVLARDLEPFTWARDHAVLRLAAICYLTKRLDVSMPVLPAFVKQQFAADSAHQLLVESMEDYIQFVSNQPLER